MRELILDLCGGSGAWSQPYRDAGYAVELVDLPRDVRLLRYEPTWYVRGILCAPPCTVFSYARNRYAPTPTEWQQALSVVDACVRAVAVYRPRWWALENPAAKLRWFLGPPTLHFRHWQYGDPAEKPTAIWGHFTVPPFTPRPRTKASTYKTSRQNADPTDAITPTGFAHAFFTANP